jgi:hypothetical protein
MSTTIEFDDLEVDVPKAKGPGGRDLGGATWKVNGKLFGRLKHTKIKAVSKFQ